MKRINILILIFLYASLNVGVLACTKTEHQTAQGGQDSGGGNTTHSSYEDVSFYYAKAIRDLNKILGTFLISSFSNSSRSSLIESLRLKIEDLSESKVNLSEGLAILIKAHQININRNGPCSSVDKPHAVGSIKEFKVSSPICISFTELSKIPKSSLEREIISLLLHEYSHALGFDEKMATEIQITLIQNFDIIFYRGTNKFVKYENRDGGILSGDGFFNAIEKSLIEEALELLTTKKIFSQKDWRNITMFVFLIEKFSEGYQNQEIHLYANLGTLFVNLNRTTFEEIDAHLENIDQLRYKLKMDSGELAYFCAKSNTQQSSAEMKVLAKRLLINLKKFNEEIEKTQEYLILD